MATRSDSEGTPRRKPRRATTPEGREDQLANLAFDFAQKQFEDGTAPAMLTLHFLKLKTVEQRLKEEKLRKENLLTEARVSSLGSSKNAEEMYAKAIAAIHLYQGRDEQDDEELQ